MGQTRLRPSRCYSMDASVQVWQGMKRWIRAQPFWTHEGVSNTNTNIVITCMDINRGSCDRHENGAERVMSAGCVICTGRSLKTFQGDCKEQGHLSYFTCPTSTPEKSRSAREHTHKGVNVDRQTVGWTYCPSSTHPASSTPYSRVKRVLLALESGLCSLCSVPVPSGTYYLASELWFWHHL